MQDYYFPKSLEFAELFVLLSGRIKRRTFILGSALIIFAFLNLYLLLSLIFETVHIYFVFFPLAWAQIALLVKRCHDIGRSGRYLFWLIIPVFGPGIVITELLFRKGKSKTNRFGTPLCDKLLDYQTVPTFITLSKAFYGISPYIFIT